MQRIVLRIALALGIAVWAATGSASPARSLYDDATLGYWQQRYSRSTARILGEGIVPVLNPAEYRAVRKTALDFPLRGDDLIGFYAKSPPPTITLPVVSLKFLDDLCIAYAWLWANGYSLETVEEYVAMLRYKKPAAYPGGQYPTPYAALGIPRTALEDESVDDLSLRFFNSARAFVLAHEIAHILYGHSGRGPNVLEDEIQADRFALDVLHRTGTIPMGIVIYFQAMAHWSPNRAQFDSETAWQEFLRRHRTHPLSGSRIASIAEALEEMAPGFVRNDPNRSEAMAVVRFIASGLRQVADYLDDEEMQLCVGQSAAAADISTLAPRKAGTGVLQCGD